MLLIALAPPTLLAQHFVVCCGKFPLQRSRVLLQLQLENYAVIDNVIVEFAPGLNLLTGETGAGKSILIDALALLLGAKASAELVRHGAEKAVVSGVFDADEAAIRPVLEENGVELEDSHIIVKREMAASG